MPEKLTEIWTLMRANRIKQKDLAQQIGCTEQYLSMVFNGKKSSSIIIDRIEQAIGEIIVKNRT